MKNIILIWALFFSTLAQAAPPTSVKGEAGGAAFTQNIVLPNYQVTKQTGINSRFETGNKNLLQNPSFEHSTIATAWINTGGGTPASSTTNLQDGTKSITTTSTGAWTFYQDVTLYASGKSGQEAEASIWVYSATASADLWLCPRVNGASVTASVANGCHQYTNLGSPQKLTVFMLYGATSTGIEIKGSGAITYILDDAYLGDRRPMAAGVTTTPAISFTPTLNAFGTSPSIACKYVREGSYMNADCFGTAGSSPAASLATITIPNSLNIDSSKISATNTTAAAGQRVGLLNFNATNSQLNIITATGTSTTLLYLSNYLNTSTNMVAQNGSAVISASTAVTFNFKIPILEWAADNNAFTTKCDDPKACETILGAFVSAAGVKSKENVPWLSGNCTYGSPVATRWNCPVTAGVFTTLPNCWVQTDTTSGGAFRHGWMDTSNSSVTNIVFATGQANAASFQSDSAFYMFCEKTGADYTASKLTQQIVQMRGVPVVPGGERVDTFSVSYYTTNATTSCTASTTCTIDQVGTGGVTSIVQGTAGAFTINLPKTYSKFKCTANAGGAVNSTTVSPIQCSSCASTTFSTYNSTTGAGQASYGTLDCKGQY